MIFRTLLRPGGQLRRLAAKLAVAAAAGVLAPTAVAGAASAGPGPIIDPNPPCYLGGMCLYETGHNGQLTGWSIYDVGPTPYYISIFNVTTGARLALCGTGTSCTTVSYVYPPLGHCNEYVAYVGGSGPSAPPSPVQRSSAPLLLCSPFN